MPPREAIEQESYRFGIGEWYGRSFVHLTSAERKHYAALQSGAKSHRPQQPCPPRSTPDQVTPCTKEGGVCSLRMYRKAAASSEVSVAPGTAGSLRTTCPYRFQQNRLIFKWIGETMLGHSQPLAVGEVGFLERSGNEGKSSSSGKASDPDDVGRIDNVLIHPDRTPLHWCAVEIQAVYFSGSSMSKEFNMLRSFGGAALPFPAANRRPDYRSSGPKRLMPQLQIKVPSLRRWGKKMAVVVDQSFFRALDQMDSVRHVSNCDVAWFVVKYDESHGEAELVPDFVQLTTLERTVEGLTAGSPVSLETFEQRVRGKLGSSPEAQI
jgi:Restriction endonuclease NotI